MAQARSTHNLTVREAHPADAAALAELWGRSIREVCGPRYGGRQGFARWADKTPARVRRALATPGQAWWVAEREGRLVGLCCISFDGIIRACYVDPAHLRHGAGRALMAEAQRWARAQGLPALRADATLNAEPFYTALGFTRQAPPRPVFAAIEAVPMLKPLKPARPA